MIRVVVADDQALVRLGLATLLADADGVSLVGEADNGRTVLDVVRRVRPDVVLMDVRMPIMDGIEALTHIVADPELPATRVIMLTTFELDDYIVDALQAGASGFLIKDTEAAEILRAIEVVARGDSLLSPTVTRRLIKRFVRRSLPRRPGPDLRLLTEREREVTAYAAEGLSNDEIAERLTISAETARTHISRAIRKLRARDRTQLVVFAYQSGLVKLDPDLDANLDTRGEL